MLNIKISIFLSLAASFSFVNASFVQDRKNKLDKIRQLREYKQGLLNGVRIAITSTDSPQQIDSLGKQIDEIKQDIEAIEKLEEQEIERFSVARRIEKGYQERSDEYKEKESQYSLLDKIRHEAWSKRAEGLIPDSTGTVYPTSDGTLDILRESIKKIDPIGRYALGQECKSEIIMYANQAELVRAQLDEFPHNKEKIARQLEIFAKGQCADEHWRTEQCTKIANSARKGLLQAMDISSKKPTVVDPSETPEQIYIDVRDVCDKDKGFNLRDWGLKSYTLSTLAAGLRVECEQQARNEEECREMERNLHKFFYAEKKE